jgi:hypothetical protein
VKSKKSECLLLLDFVDPAKLGITPPDREILRRVVDLPQLLEPRRFHQAYLIEVYASDMAHTEAGDAQQCEGSFRIRMTQRRERSEFGNEGAESIKLRAEALKVRESGHVKQWMTFWKKAVVSKRVRKWE